MYFNGWHTASTCLLYEYIKDKLYLFYDKYEYVVFFLNLHSSLRYTYQTVALSVSCAIPVLQYWAVIVVAIFFSRLGFSRNMVGKVWQVNFLISLLFKIIVLVVRMWQNFVTVHIRIASFTSSHKADQSRQNLNRTHTPIYNSLNKKRTLGNIQNK